MPGNLNRAGSDRSLDPARTTNNKEIRSTRPPAAKPRPPRLAPSARALTRRNTQHDEKGWPPFFGARRQSALVHGAVRILPAAALRRRADCRSGRSRISPTLAADATMLHRAVPGDVARRRCWLRRVLAEPVLGC